MEDQEDHQLAMAMVCQLEVFFWRLQQITKKRKSLRILSYLYGHFLYDVECILANCITSTMKVEVMKIKERIVIHICEVLGLETASTLVLALNRMQRIKDSSSLSLVSSLEGEVCVICQEEFKVERLEPEEEVIVLFCSHKYHERCIFGWLASSGHCPICRVDLASPDAA